MTPSTSARNSFVLRAAILLLIILLTVLVCVFNVDQSSSAAMLFQSPLPEKEEEVEVHPGWISAGDGGIQSFGRVTVVLPRGFTEQSGATVIGNIVVVPVGIEERGKLLPGTEFALGIWPPNDQVEYQNPIEIRLGVNAAGIAPNTEDNLAIIRYVPSMQQWVVLPTKFDRATYELVASTTTMTPVARDFSEWGGRTFFAVTDNGEATSQPTNGARIIRIANIRRGPGVTYSAVRVAKAGEVVAPIGKSNDGRWLMLEDRTWVAAFLVDNAPAVPIVNPTNASSSKP